MLGPIKWIQMVSRCAEFWILCMSSANNLEYGSMRQWIISTNLPLVTWFGYSHLGNNEFCQQVMITHRHHGGLPRWPCHRPPRCSCRSQSRHESGMACDWDVQNLNMHDLFQFTVSCRSILSFSRISLSLSLAIAISRPSGNLAISYGKWHL